MIKCVSPRFPLGQIVATRGIVELGDKIEDFTSEIANIVFNEYVFGNWGVVGEEDSLENEKAIREGSRVLGAYHVKGHKIWIITEHDRSVTTILLPSEY